MSIRLGDMNERVKVRTPKGETSTDDRDAYGFVDQHGGALGSPEYEAWARVRELSTQEMIRAGGEAGQRLYSVVMQADLPGGASLDERRVIVREDGTTTMEIVSVRTPSHTSQVAELLCKRAI